MFIRVAEYVHADSHVSPLSLSIMNWLCGGGGGGWDILFLAHAHRFDQVHLDCLQGSVEYSLNVCHIDRQSKRFVD
jgi:hypothetical protein